MSAKTKARVDQVTTRHTQVSRDLLKRAGSRRRIHRLVKPAYSYKKICQLLSPLRVTYHSSDRYRTTQMRREAVVAFLSSISIQLPEAKTAGRSFLTCSMKAAHSKFLSSTSNSKLLFSTFCKFRPESVRPVDEIPNRMSVCPSCKNVRLKALALSAVGV